MAAVAAPIPSEAEDFEGEPMSDTILELDHIEKRFGDTGVLHGVSLSVQHGEFVTLLGPSGCGKTTTLRIIAGLETPDAGRVVLRGKDVTAAPPEKRDVNTVFQNYALFPHMSVAANIGYSLRLKKMPRAEIAKEVERRAGAGAAFGLRRTRCRQSSRAGSASAWPLPAPL